MKTEHWKMIYYWCAMLGGFGMGLIIVSLEMKFVVKLGLYVLGAVVLFFVHQIASSLLELRTIQTKSKE